VTTGAFWSGLAPEEHICQLYGHEVHLIDALTTFTDVGLRSGEGVVVIATAAHLHQLEQRLRRNWLDLDRARWEERYIAVLAQETLNRFMVDGWPDAEKFRAVADSLLKRARGNGRKVRAFGEMVALLWAQGNAAATIRLENLWNDLQRREQFSLLCGYARSDFGEDAAASLRTICSLHSRVIPSR
jgi:hypothetical protein